MEEYEYRIAGEPTSYDAPVDFDRQFEIIHRKLEDERNRADRIDSKAATLIAGVIAILGFSLEHFGNRVEAAALLLFAWPLWHLYQSYKTIEWDDAPSVADMAKKFPWFPKTSIASGAVAMAESVVANGPKIDAKARQLNRGFRAALIVTAIVVVIRVASFFSTGVLNNGEQRRSASQSTTSSADSATTSSPHVPKHDGIRGKSAQDREPKKDQVKR